MVQPLPILVAFKFCHLGVGFKKVLAMDAQTTRHDDVIAGNKDRLAHVDDEGVTFKSHRRWIDASIYARSFYAGSTPNRCRHHVRL